MSLRKPERDDGKKPVEYKAQRAGRDYGNREFEHVRRNQRGHEQPVLAAPADTA